MPIYQFIHEDSGNVVEKTMSFAEHDRRVKDGKLRHRGKVYEQIVTGGLMFRFGAGPLNSRSGQGSTYPMKSCATGVGVGQIKEAMANDRANGVHGVTYDPKSGDAVYTCRSMRKKHCESLGMYDKNGGYSDPQRGKVPAEA